MRVQRRLKQGLRANRRKKKANDILILKAATPSAHRDGNTRDNGPAVMEARIFLLSLSMLLRQHGENKTDVREARERERESSRRRFTI